MQIRVRGSQLDSFSLPGDWFPDRWSDVSKPSNREHHVALEPTVTDRSGSCTADAQFVCSGGNVLTADSVGSGGETRHQHYNEFGAGKLDSVYFQSIPTDEAKRAGYFLRRLDAALATLE